MTPDEKKLAELDAITVGQIRRRLNANLERQIVELAGMIRASGCGGLHKAKEHMDGAIAGTLTQLQKLTAWATTEVMFPWDRTNEKTKPQ
jgi:hypothetical protein